MEKTDILIFDVGMGQSIFVYPHFHPEYGMLVDCGNTEDFEPIDFLLEKGFIPKHADNKTNVLHNLTLTNYDQDHFSGLPYLRSKVWIRTVNFASNLSSADIKSLKEPPYSNALEHACDVKDTYTQTAQNYNPPYAKTIFLLQKTDLAEYDTNNLSQVLFIEQHGSVICISGDLEEDGWNIILRKQPAIKTLLARTNVFVASHHGRENGYCPVMFNHCAPECIIISDKGIVHDTQRNMSSLYGGHVVGGGVPFNGSPSSPRKVLTTRDVGHIWIQLDPGGVRTYRNFSHD